MALYEVLADGTIVPKAGHTVGNLHCLRPVLLWENDSPALSFPQRTIEDITPNNCDYFEIGYRYDTTNNFQKSDLIKADAGVRGLLSFVNTPNIMFARALTINSKTSISFSASYRGNGSSESMDNTTIIPLYVIGYTKEPAMIYTGAELHEGNGIKIENGVISQAPRNIAINSYYIGSNPEIVANASNSEASVVSVTINKQYETSKLLVMSSVPIKNNDQGWGGGTSIKIDGVTKCIKRVVSYSGDVALDYLIPDISSGVHTVSLNVLYGGGGAGGGSVSMPQYSNAVIIVEEVLV